MINNYAHLILLMLCDKLEKKQLKKRLQTPSLMPKLSLSGQLHATPNEVYTGYIITV